MEKVILPTDIIVEIFSWLPARSIGRFRTLSKLYHWLLSQPSFIKKHLFYGSGSSNTKLLVSIKMSHPKKTLNFYYPIDNNITSDTVEASEVNYSAYEVVDVTVVGNSCNGLFCVRDRKGLLALWNPTTKEASCLPELAKVKNSWHQCSFGYDPLNEDYKVACVRGNLGERHIIIETYMYSHKRGCWKKIEPFPPYCMKVSRINNQFVHGKIHWIVHSSPHEDGKIQYKFIVSLDLADERYGTVALPTNYRYHPPKDIDVCVLGGELCVSINSEYGFEIWMMREYGVEQSWFQLLTIPVHNLRYSIHGGSALCIPFFLLKSGEILLWAKEFLGASIYLYNPKTCNFITVKTLSACHTFNYHLFGQIYVESLVETTISYKGQSFVALA